MGASKGHNREVLSGDPSRSVCVPPPEDSGSGPSRSREYQRQGHFLYIDNKRASLGSHRYLNDPFLETSIAVDSVDKALNDGGAVMMSRGPT